MAHTPGPWAFSEGDRERAAMSLVHKKGDKEFLLAYVICESRNEEARAMDIDNARLITAAPTLLAACQDALDCMPDGTVHDATQSQRDAIKTLRAAIALATGSKSHA